ncbi:MAG: hypothetical protein D6762_01595 [Candidatus Neomarinimicrobiota bacterium]|nr:MAG: hypothetical protein D6762_01595 [Candidatus Neomarinimicrobiota bacterium]
MKRENSFLYGLVAVLVLFLMIHVGIVWFTAGQSFPLVSRDYYARELRYQERLDRLNRARTLAAAIQVSADAGRLILRFPAEQVSADLAGTLRLFRPADDRLDRSFPLKLGRDGTQLIPVPNLATGRWIVYLDWEQAGQGYSVEKDLYVE